MEDGNRVISFFFAGRSQLKYFVNTPDCNFSIKPNKAMLKQKKTLK